MYLCRMLSLLPFWKVQKTKRKVRNYIVHFLFAVVLFGVSDETHTESQIFILPLLCLNHASSKPSDATVPNHSDDKETA